MEDKALHILFEREEYKRNKENILSSQIDLLNSMKSIQNLTKIKSEKAKLKIKLKKLFSSLSDDLENIQEKIPDPKIPRKSKIQSSKKPEIEPDFEEQIKEQSIENELLRIQEKLEQLNA